VSHDRYFISKTANKIWEIVNHEIKEFKGTYQEWVDWNERMEKQRAAQAKEAKGKDHTATQSPARTEIKQQEQAAPQVPKTAIDKEAQKELQKQQKLFQKLEQQLADLNKRKSDLEAQLGAPDIYSNKEKFAETERQYKLLNEELKSCNAAYEQAFEKLMELEG
jgi:ATP-binding cassette subfamily F protein 3